MKILSISLLILFFYGCSSSKIEDLDTIFNYEGAIVVSKEPAGLFENKGYIYLRIKEGDLYSIKKILVLDIEFNSITRGDTIKSDIELIKPKNTIDLVSIENFRGSYVIEKNVITSTLGNMYILTIKDKERYGWKIYKIRVVKSEYDSVKIGDRI